VAVPRLAVLDNQDSVIRVDGQIDLRDETLALRAVVRPKDFSLLSLRSPLTVTGTLADPVVGIEGRQLAARGVAALALATVAAPIAALVPFIDPGSRETGDPCVVPPPAQAASASAVAHKETPGRPKVP
jgi:AsmA family protein